MRNFTGEIKMIDDYKDDLFALIRKNVGFIYRDKGIHQIKSMPLTKRDMLIEAVDKCGVFKFEIYEEDKKTVIASGSTRNIATVYAGACVAAIGEYDSFVMFDFEDVISKFPPKGPMFECENIVFPIGDKSIRFPTKGFTDSGTTLGSPDAAKQVFNHPFSNEIPRLSKGASLKNYGTDLSDSIKPFYDYDNDSEPRESNYWCDAFSNHSDDERPLSKAEKEYLDSKVIEPVKKPVITNLGKVFDSNPMMLGGDFG